MDKTVVVALIAAAAAVAAAVFSWRASARATDRQAELGWARELRQDAADARREIDQLRNEIREVRRQLELAQREADHWLTEHQAMRRQAWRPGMTMDRLRDLIGPMDPPATANGR